mgnify:CR=1 FL=1
MAFLEPDRYFARISRIDIDRDLLALGFRNVLLDVDNTILTRDTHEVPRDVGFWLAKARDAGITFCLVSNNWHEGVYHLANRLRCPSWRRPSSRCRPRSSWLCARWERSVPRRWSIGDQLVTDVMGAHFWA